jgi:hypothetical protein
MCAALLTSSLAACTREVIRPVVSPAPACFLPAWPSTSPIAACEKTDLMCVITSVGLYIRDAERVYAASKSCPGIKWVPYVKPQSPGP